MLQIFWTVFVGIVNLIKIPVFFILGVIFVFLILVMINIIIGYAKGRRFKKGHRKFIKKPGFLKRVFIDFPTQYVDDLFNKDPDFFKYQGMVIFEGRQGRGKSISMVQFGQQMREEFPLSKMTTNLGVINEDNEIKHWHDLVDYKNGFYGVIALLDELQNWFSSNQSKNFPPEMLGLITQNRKNRRIILGTSQNFYMLSKAIRSQTTEVRRCTTILGCLTIVRRYEPFLDSEGNVVEFKYRGMYFFVHDKKLRESYDTWKTISSLAQSGFQDRIQGLENISNNTYIIP